MPETRTYADRSAYLIRAVAKRRKHIKQMAVELKGGKCCLCGYDRCIEALDLHHCKGVKKFGIGSKGYTRSWKAVCEELEKCVLLCANCHREVESGFAIVPGVILENFEL